MGFLVGPRFRDSLSRLAVKRDAQASLHCRVEGDVPLHLAWRRSSSSTSLLSSNYRFFFFKFARWFKQKIEFDSNNDDGHMFMVRLRIQEKEAPPSGLVSTLTIIGTQVEDVSNMFHVSLIM